MTTRLFFAKRKPRQCPACKSKKIASIMYGYPSGEAVVQAEAKKIVFGDGNSEVYRQIEEKLR